MPHILALPPGEAFLDAVAAAFLERCSDACDLSGHLVLVHSPPLAADLRQALVRVAGRPLLLPRFETLRRWAAAEPQPELTAPLPDSERLLLLHEALRSRGWFDEGALWGMAGEMAALFDELTAHAVTLPENEAELAAELERAYALRASAPLAFEARVVHELWRALAAAGRPDEAAAYGLRLAGLAEQAGQPLWLLLDAPLQAVLEPAEQLFLQRYAQRQPVVVLHPAPRASEGTPMLRLLAAAWPAEGAPPLYLRAQALAAALPQSPLAGRLELVAAHGREQEARAATGLVRRWLAMGLRRIALIAQDRLTARRVRALLERDGILVADETGWKLSTSRAAAAVDALLETAVGGGYFRDLLDLLKSPYVFADLPETERRAAVFALEQAIRAGNARSGLPRMRRALSDHGEASPATALAAVLLDRVEAATTLLRSKAASLPRWLDRLGKALEAIGAVEPLHGDAAGSVLLELLAARRGELDGSAATFSFAAWRDWLNREFEAANFRDRSIASPLVLTSLGGTRLRRFEAALLLGGDARQLAPAANGAFFNQAVRRELGLPTRADAERVLRRDLELLLTTVPRVAVTWQAESEGEAQLLAPEFDLLSTLHQLAYGDDLQRSPPPLPAEAAPEAATAPAAPRRATPVASAALLPRRVSVSGYASLVACPYRFFARHVLGLGEMDEVSEEMAKSDYGALVHRVLERFHERHPVLAALDDAQALAALRAIVEEVFAAAIEENYLALGWRLRWEKRLVAYVDWQRRREAEGWRWQAAETRVSRMFALTNGELELYGRIDRIDAGGDGDALLDYKTQTVKRIRDHLPDDVQLPAYALMHGATAQAAYVALDDERIEAVAAGGDDLAAAAAAQGTRLVAAFDAMRAGTPLPAHGVDSVCAWCEMSGLCRRDHV